VVVQYFKEFFKSRDIYFINEHVHVTKLFSRVVFNEETNNLYAPMTLDEVKDVLSLFRGDKSPGPDGWTMKLFSTFIDLVGEDLVQIIEESRKNGSITRSLNSTFLALIPKENKSTSFGDYTPISLCNLCYKLISKFISNWIKPIV